MEERHERAASTAYLKIKRRMQLLLQENVRFFGTITATVEFQNGQPVYVVVGDEERIAMKNNFSGLDTASQPIKN